MTDLTPGERWARGIDHDPRSEKIYHGIAKIDWEQCSDSFCFKHGGDGDNGETLMYLLDCYFAELERVDITDIGLEKRIVTLLLKHDIRTVAKLVSFSETDLLCFRGYGETIILRIQFALAEIGFALRPERQTEGSTG